MKEAIIKGQKFLYLVGYVDDECDGGYVTDFYLPEEHTKVVKGGGKWSWIKFNWEDIEVNYRDYAFQVDMDIDSPYNDKEEVQEEIERSYKRYLEIEARKKEIEETKILVID